MLDLRQSPVFVVVESLSVIPMQRIWVQTGFDNRSITQYLTRRQLFAPNRLPLGCKRGLGADILTAKRIAAKCATG